MMLLGRIIRFCSELKKRILVDVLQIEPSDVDESAPATNARAPSIRMVDLPKSLSMEDTPAIFAIGDIHGRYDLLYRMIEAVRADCIESAVDGLKPHVVFLGDYIDRGFQSKKVIDTLIELQEQSDFEPIFLKGNHEAVLLSFLDNPSVGEQWSNFGGRETLISYGVTPPRDLSDGEDWIRAQQELMQKIPPAHVEFLESLVTNYQLGPYGFVHAGVKSGVPFEEQSDEDRLWIRGEFLNASRREDLFIIHGHSPVDAPYIDHRRINVDTGSYYSGRLTAVKLTASAAVFLTI